MNAFVPAATVPGLGEISSPWADETPIVLQLKAGSEDAYSWLIARYHAPIYSLVSRLLSNSADAADTTQEIFLKVFRGMKRFNGSCSLKTWLYRIAIHETSNQRRWWSRHGAREVSIAPLPQNVSAYEVQRLEDTLPCEKASPLESVEELEFRVRIEHELRQLREPYRTAVVLRDLEGLSYADIAAVTETCEATVKSRLARGRNFLKERLRRYIGFMPKRVSHPCLY